MQKSIQIYFMHNIVNKNKSIGVVIIAFHNHSLTFPELPCNWQHQLLWYTGQCNHLFCSKAGEVQTVVNSFGATNSSKRQEHPNLISINVLCIGNVNSGLVRDTYLLKKFLWTPGSSFVVMHCSLVLQQTQVTEGKSAENSRGQSRKSSEHRPCPCPLRNLYNTSAV